MKLYRYMSTEEYDLYRTGETIEGREQNSHSSVEKGVCFLPEVIEDNQGRKYTPEEALYFLAGIVSRDELLVSFEATKEAEKELVKGWGYYADPYGPDGIIITEYSLPEYSKETLVNARVVKPAKRKINTTIGTEIIVEITEDTFSWSEMSPEIIGPWKIYMRDPRRSTEMYTKLSVEFQGCRLYTFSLPREGGLLRLTEYAKEHGVEFEPYCNIKDIDDVFPKSNYLERKIYKQ